MEEEQNAEGCCCDTTRRSAPKMLLRSQTGPFSLANKTDEDLSYKKNSFVPDWLLDPLRNSWIRVKECVSSSLSFLQNTRDGTIIPSRALLLLVACYHDQNHTHYLVEVIEVVVGGRSRWMSWRRRRWPLPPTCSRYSVCRHYCPHFRRSGLAVCHPVVYCRHPAKRDHFGCEFIGNNMKKKTVSK